MTKLMRMLVGVALLACLAPWTRGDVWTQFIASAEAAHGDAGRRAAEFLAEHRPPRDEHVELVMLEENLRYALRAREEFPWAQALTDEMFFNEVLPYASIDETRESWRPGFYEKAKTIVEGSTTATEAAQALNREFFNLVNVHYDIRREKNNQSPAESIRQSMATCTGLSIILVDACRAVGVPARITGIANWTSKRGNHTWVEIWDGGWHFTGADEYNDKGLNRAWFERDASKAIAGHVEHGVWSTSWARTGRHFPLSWNMGDTTVPAVDVTHRYTGGEEAEDEAVGRVVYVRVWTARGGERIACRVDSVDTKGSVIDLVTSRAGRTDLNDMPALRVSDATVSLVVHHGGGVRVAAFDGSLAPGETLDLYWDELAHGLGQAEAEGLVERMAAEMAGAVRERRSADLEAAEIKVGRHTLRLLEKTFGEAPEHGHSLWISMHGGGGAPAEVNDKQWRNQITLYEPAEGIYVAPRAPTNTWNLWHRAHIDRLFDRLIESYVVARGVNPDRVYLMGYSAGGDGVFQLAPRMADRFAAAAMMAGHPNETKPLGLRNLPFALLMGGEDSAYNRNTVARRWEGELAALQQNDPEGYPHRVEIYEGLGHWMEKRDAEVLPWMAERTRDPWPTKVVWHQDDVTHNRFYWLAVDEPAERTTVTATVDGQTIAVETEDLTSLTLRLRDRLIDLDRPVTVTVNGSVVFEGIAPRTAAAVFRSLEQRHDPASAATAEIRLAW